MKDSTSINNGGFAVVYGLIVLFIASIAGVSLITISQKDNISAVDHVKIRAAAVAAEAALVAVEKQFENQPQVIVDILNRFTAAGTNTANRGWLLSTADNWTQETRIRFDVANSASPSYSARILSFDATSRVVQVEGYGFGGAGGRKKVIGLYQLSGIAQATPISRYALYMGGESKNFDKPVNITGNVYFNDSVQFNGGAAGSIIDGTVQALSTTSPFLVLSSVTFKDNVLFMGPTTLQAIVNFNGRVGFDKAVAVNNGPMQCQKDLYFNNTITGNSAFDLNTHVAHRSAVTINASRITDGTIVQDGATINVANSVSLSSTPQLPFQVDISVIPASFIKTISGNVNATTIQNLYASSSSSLWKGYLVIKPAAYAAMQRVSSGSNTVTCNTIWIVDKMMFSNDGWYDCGPNTMTVIYLKSKGQINGLGSAAYFRGYIHGTDTSNVTYNWKTGNNFVGAAHHISKFAKFQMNSAGGTWNITWDQTVLTELINIGLVTVPGGVPTGALVLSDLCVRPKIVGKFF
jgi:hypothetical protein